MIGKIGISKSFKRCLGYCLDKKQSEVLDYNLCGGNKQELLEQMADVRNQNQRQSKPVQHMSISFPKGDNVDRNMLIQIADECAREMAYQQNQYVVIQHHDTEHKHIHIVINRIDFDGKTLSKGHNFWRIAEFCRKMEEKFHLKKELNPRRFQTPEQRQIPRSNQRNTKLKSAIINCLWKANNYEEFLQLMKLKGYNVQKTKGISFIDSKKKQVRIKGSEVGYAWSKIENILLQKTQLQQQLMIKQVAGCEHQEKLSPLLDKMPSNNLSSKGHNKQNLLDMLTGKQNFKQNVNEQFKKKKQQQRRHL